MRGREGQLTEPAAEDGVVPSAVVKDRGVADGGDCDCADDGAGDLEGGREVRRAGRGRHLAVSRRQEKHAPVSPGSIRIPSSPCRPQALSAACRASRPSERLDLVDERDNSAAHARRQQALRRSQRLYAIGIEC